MTRSSSHEALCANLPLLAMVVVIYGLLGSAAFAGDGQSDQMLSRPCVAPEPCHQTWTLTSRLGHILDQYEARVGPRNRAYRLLGLEFTTDARPRTWYPDYGKGPRNLIVQLTQDARQNRTLALFQLGHEAFHLLEPIKAGSQGSYLEEGLASLFSIDYMKTQGIKGGEAMLTELEYRKAYDLVVQVAKLHGDFDARLKRLRAASRSFSRVTLDAFRAAFPKAPAEVAQKLVSGFPIKGFAGNRR